MFEWTGFTYEGGDAFGVYVSGKYHILKRNIKQRVIIQERSRIHLSFWVRAVVSVIKYKFLCT